MYGVAVALDLCVGTHPSPLLPRTHHSRFCLNHQPQHDASSGPLTRHYGTCCEEYSVGSREAAAGRIMQSLAEMDTAASASDSEVVQTGQRVVFDSPASMPGWITPDPAPTTTWPDNAVDRRRASRANHVSDPDELITLDDDDDDVPAPTPPTSNCVHRTASVLAASTVAAERDGKPLQIQQPPPASIVQTQQPPSANIVQTQRPPPAKIMHPSNPPPLCLT